MNHAVTLISTDTLSLYQKIAAETRYDDETGTLWWTVSRTGRKLQKPIGNACKQTRGLRLKFAGVQVRLHRYIWWLKTGEIVPDSVEIDHKDGDFTNNRFNNLRKSDDAQNSRNRSAFKNNKLGIKGVCQVPSGKFLAYIYHDGRQHRIGEFDRLDDAISARKERALQIQGSFAFEARL